MKIFAEVVFEVGKGKKRMYQIKDFICKKRDIFDGIDIPESPLGIPSINSIVAGSLVKGTCPELSVFSHMRLIDLNPISFISLLSSAELANIDSIFITQGEKNEKKDSYLLSTEEAFALASKYGLSERLGAILSLSYEFEAINRRLEAGFKRFLVLRFSEDNSEKFLAVAERAKKAGIELYPYIILKTERNKDIIERMGQPSYEAKDLKEIVKKLEGFVGGIVLSTAGDFKSLLSLEIH